jgi:hypothetical protein
MKRNEEILNELMTISPLLAKVSNENVFSVPEGYFKTLNQLILSKTAAQNPTLSVPEGYFEKLSGSILSRIKEEDALAELRGLSPMLYSVQNENVYKVPAGYFDRLASVILSKVQAPARVISMQSRSIWKYAVAAVITGVITVNSMWIFNKPTEQVAYNTLKAKPGMPAYISEATQYKTEDDIQNGVASLSNDDIINYLQSTGTVADNEILNSELDTKDLPLQKDYLDEQTLDAMLQQIQSTN